jgi:signal transduction histidine kinase
LISEAPFLLLDQAPRARHRRLACVIVGGLIVGLIAALPLAGTALHGTDDLVPAYAAIILIVDVVTATLLLAQFAVHGAPALLALAIGYLASGLTVIPWALTFPGVFSPTGLLGAGLQTTALIAAVRRLLFPVALLAYAWIRHRPAAQVVEPSATGPLIRLTVLACVALTCLVTWLAVAGERWAPAFMTGPRASTASWTLVLYMSLALTLAAGAILFRRRRRSVLDLWLLVTVAAFLSEIVLLGFVGAGLRFSAGWWVGRAFGLVASSILMLALLAEITTLHARLVGSLLAQRREQETRATTLEALAAALAHELNQPLASIVASANAATRWLDRPAPDLAEARGRLARIASDGHMAGEIIESVRRAFGRRRREDALVDLRVVAREAAAVIGGQARLAGARLETDLSSDPTNVRGDAVALRQAVLNLLSNALDSVQEVGQGPRTIRLGCAIDSGTALLYVADSGSGLEQAERLFDPFHSTKRNGMGLGLMICRTIVESHGGRVRARPNAPRGAIFEMALPLAPRSA